MAHLCNCIQEKKIGVRVQGTGVRVQGSEVRGQGLEVRGQGTGVVQGSVVSNECVSSDCYM